MAEKAEEYDWKSEKISYDDFLKLSEESENRYEYIDGEDSGIKEYWIVSPLRKEVYAYCFEEQDIKEYRVYKGVETVQSMTFEGLEIPLEQIFA